MRYLFLLLALLALSGCDSPTVLVAGDDGTYELVGSSGTHPVFGTPYTHESGEMSLYGGEYSYSITHRSLPEVPPHTYEITGTFYLEERGLDRYVVFSGDNQEARVVGDKLEQDWRETIRLTWQRTR